eukprot:1970046-Amphidinium_carterae.1
MPQVRLCPWTWTPSQERAAKAKTARAVKAVSTAAQMRTGKIKANKEKFAGECWVCGKTGHKSSECWYKDKKGKEGGKGKKGGDAKGKGKAANSLEEAAEKPQQPHDA